MLTLESGSKQGNENESERVYAYGNENERERETRNEMGTENYIFANFCFYLDFYFVYTFYSKNIIHNHQLVMSKLLAPMFKRSLGYQMQ